MIGIDISKWQGTMRWDVAVSKGVEFAYIKASQGVSVDPEWSVNSYNCNLKYKGAYHFLDYSSFHYTIGQEELWGKAQADFFLETVGAWGNLTGMLDIENNTAWERLDQNYPRAVKIALAFKREYEAKTGHKLGVYMNLSTTRAGIWGAFTDGPLWMAQYNKTMSTPGCWSKWHIWQYTDKGDGASYGAESTYIDLNVSNDETFNELVTDGGTPTPVIPPEVKTKTVELKTVQVPVLRMRAGPGVGYPIVGSLKGGAVVEILDTAQVGADVWMRVGQGQWSAALYKGQEYLR